MQNTVLVAVAGVLLLSTLFVPWLVPGKKSVPWLPHEGAAVMSWDLFRHCPGSVGTLLVAGWIVGLTAVVLSFVVRGLALSISTGGLGLLGMVLLSVVAVDVVDQAKSGALAGMTSSFVLQVFYGVLFLTYIIVTSVRLRVGDFLAVRIVQGIAAGGALILSVVCFVHGITQYADLLPGIREKLAFDVVLACVFELMVLAACIAGLVHAASVRFRSAALSAASLSILYLYLGALAVYMLIRGAVAAGDAGAALLLLNILNVTAPILFLFCSGVTASICLGVSAARQGSPSSRPAPASTPMETAASERAAAGPEVRLRELNSLLERGVLSPEEFAAAKRKMLSDV
jgi:hypothetical protein